MRLAWFFVGAAAALVADRFVVLAFHRFRQRRWRALNGIHPVSKETLAALRRLVEKGAQQ